MVKLIYTGRKASGFVKGLGFVKLGEEYDVTPEFAKRLLVTGEWKKVYREKKVKFEKPKEKIIEDRFLD